MTAEYALFQRGDFTLHSGEKSGFKIDCDALTDTDLDTIAWMLANRLPLFGKVEGIPTGGLRLAAAMERYARPVQSGLLIVDDVWTTGRSMETHRDFRVGVMGAVIFARSPVPAWVTPLFMLAPTLIDGCQSPADPYVERKDVQHNDRTMDGINESIRPFSQDDVIRAARDWRYSDELIGGMMRRWLRECAQIDGGDDVQ